MTADQIMGVRPELRRGPGNRVPRRSASTTSTFAIVRTMSCPELETLEEVRTHSATAELEREVLAHLPGCESCRETWEDLRADAELVARLERPSVKDRLRPAPPPLPGYEIGAEIHRGGQGIVFAGRQSGTGRAVAIKILHGGAHESERLRARFLREIEAVSQLRHEGIVTVHEGGVAEGGTPYLVMEHVPGLPLDHWQDAHRPGVDEAVQILLRIADAVAYAHDQGVIHRDLKAANILVDEQMRPRVLDFGLAKFTADADLHTLTAPETFVGTLISAAPEQVAGKSADARTDLYALGLLLYRLLTGRDAVVVHESLREMLRQISEVDPAPPSHLVPSVARDLDAITMKALAKEPSDRYGSVREFIADLERSRRGEIVLARESERGYVLRRTLRRHRRSLVSIAVVLLSLVVAAVWSWRAAEEAKKERDHARRQTAIAQSITGFLSRAFERATPRSGGGELSLTRFVQIALEDLETRFEPHHEASGRLALTLGTTLLHLGDFEGALTALHRSESTMKLDPNADVLDLLRVQERIILAMASLGRTAAAGPRVEALSRALAQARGLHPADRHAISLTLAGLLADSEPDQALAMLAESPLPPDTPMTTRAKRVYVQANALLEQGKTKEVVDLLAVERPRFATVPDLSPAIEVELALVQASALLMREEFPEGTKLLEPTYARALTALGPDHPNTNRVRYTLGYALGRLERTDEATTIFIALLESDARQPYPVLRDLDQITTWLSGRSDLTIPQRDAALRARIRCTARAGNAEAEAAAWGDLIRFLHRDDRTDEAAALLRARLDDANLDPSLRNSLESWLQADPTSR